MKQVKYIFLRELRAYFATPLAYVFVVIFLALMGAFTFYLGGFFERGQADLQSFFVWHPWLYLFLVPALGMRLWAEENKTGTIELLLTQPVSIVEVMAGKFFAAWAMIALSLGLTFPIWLTVNILGSPDNGVIVSAYIGSLLMAAAFLAIATALSAITSNQVIAFILSTICCFVFLLSGYPLVLEFFRGWLPDMVVSAISYLSFLRHFDSSLKGMLDLRSVVFFITFSFLWLWIGTRIVACKRT
jgi:ABC-2 type transport system permease protein